jgi:hypothetical protein
MTVSRTATGVQRDEEVTHKVRSRTETTVRRSGDAILISQVTWKGDGPLQTIAGHALLRVHVQDGPFIAELILKACEDAALSSDEAAA